MPSSSFCPNLHSPFIIQPSQKSDPHFLFSNCSPPIQTSCPLQSSQLKLLLIALNVFNDLNLNQMDISQSLATGSHWCSENHWILVFWNFFPWPLDITSYLLLSSLSPSQVRWQPVSKMISRDSHLLKFTLHSHLPHCTRIGQCDQ